MILPISRRRAAEQSPARRRHCRHQHGRDNALILGAREYPAQSPSPHWQIPMASLAWRLASLMAAHPPSRLKSSPESRTAFANSSTDVLVMNPKDGLKLA